MLLLTLLQACSSSIDHTPVVLITGADSHTGYALAEEYAEQGWQVIATCREPGSAALLQSLADQRSNITIEAMDVRAHQQIDALAAKYADTAIDVLINNEELRPGNDADEIGALDFDAFDSYMTINLMAPLKIAETFLPHVAASEHKKIITISSIDSSLSGVRNPGDYFYRASKAAVNIVMVTMAPDLSQHGITVGIIAPSPAEENSREALASKAKDILATIDSFSVATSSMFKTSDGRTLAW